ncbi:uncharacterized protein PV09_00648 [Verruconis gallopava]|uniref:Uncharacterized protein n=1 Tax=Verruconis gallopava TaxID=253628 RepID=A0A0D1Y0U0_9PEZI|nr:uncharacterized protein PV09_00648 [Verruconis gallopava]KIW08701.1 hypothetical protein PV09_00648 [Verruconis gallopava]
MLLSASSLVLLSLASSILAKTDLAGCTSTVSGASILYYVPDTGEICSILDCGGGRAPPKTDVPGCAAYQGSAPYMPSYLSGFGSTATLTSTGPVPTTGILTDSSIPSPASTLISIASPASLLETTTTLSFASTASLVTSSLIYDTSVASSSVTKEAVITSASAASTATSNAAVRAKDGREFMVAALGAVAAFAL